MIKIIYPFIFVLFLFNVTYAQPTLTGSTNNPSVGEVYFMHAINGSLFSPGPSGQNVTWDFSSFSSSGTDSSKFVSKSSTSGGSQFTNANMASVQSSGEAFWLFDNNEFSFCGIYNSSQTQKYTDKREYLQYPVTYNTTHTTTFGGDIISSGYQMTRSGSSTTLADAYGDLIMPYGVTVKNVLRVRIVGTYTDDWNGTTIANYVDTAYYWFSTSTGQPLVSYNIVYNNGSPVGELFNYLDQSVVSVNELSALPREETIHVYPNPAVEHINITNTSNAFVSVKLMNNLGQVVKSFNIAGMAKKVYPTDDLESGMYIVHVCNQDGMPVNTKKVIVQ